MSVTLRWKENKDGSKTAFLDIYENRSRRKKNIGIKILKNDNSKKEKKIRAEAIRTKFHNEILSNKYDLVSETKINSDFLQFFQSYIDENRSTGVRKYIYAYEKFVDYLITVGRVKGKGAKHLVHKYHYVNERLSFNDLSIALCQDYKDYLYSNESGLNGETPYDYFKRFKAVVNRAFRDRYLTNNPTTSIKVSKPKSDLKKQILTEAELSILYKTPCGGTGIKRAFIFACFTGLGYAEIKELKWKHLRNGQLNFKRAKNGNPIQTVLSKTAIEVLGDFGQDEQNVFKLPSDTTISKHLKGWMKRAAINKHITFYCGRHTFAVMALTKGANLVTVSKLMGHSDTSATMKYLNYLEQAKEAAIERLPVLEL